MSVIHRRKLSLAALLAAVLLTCLAVYYASSGNSTAPQSAPSAYMEGDIIFQITHSPQSRAIQFATGSEYTHCGILFKKNGKMYVYEAIRTVSWTPLENWIERGEGGHFVLMRLKDQKQLPDDGVLKAMKNAGQSMAGKPYDLLFQWSDDKIYCSELVWKIYERGAGIALSPLRTFRDYHLDNPVVLAIIKERYGNTMDLDEKAVAPSDILDSPLLERVGGN